MITAHRLTTLFSPASVALVGASDRSAWSALADRALRDGGFAGDVHYVNPRGGIAHGHPLLTSCAELPADVDCAYVMVPQRAVLETLEQLAAAGVRNAVILSSGFAETGAKGRELQDRIARLAAQEDMALLGPNALGFINIAANTHLFPMADAEPGQGGSIGIVATSGNLAGQLLRYARAHGRRPSILVATGNEVVVSAVDCIDYLLEDEQTRVVAGFVETLGDPARFRAVAEKALARNKPIVLIKAGRSETSQRAALAHTGALVGDDAVIDAAFRQLGVIRVAALEDVFHVAELLSALDARCLDKVGVVTISGGQSSVVADQAHQRGIALADFAAQTVAELRPVLPSFASVMNPLDLTGAAVGDPELWVSAMRAIGGDPGIDLVAAVASSAQLAPVDGKPLGVVADAVVRAQVPAITVTPMALAVGADLGERHLQAGAPLFTGGIDRFTDALAHAATFRRALTRRPEAKPERSAPTLDLAAGPPQIGTWSEAQARAILAAGGVPVGDSWLASTAQEAGTHADALGYPVVIKIVSPEIVHKSDIGGVVLGLSTRHEVEVAFRAVMSAAREQRPDATIEGVLVSPERRNGLELLVGVVRDDAWGPILSVGLGGLWVDVFRDTAQAPLPVGRDEVRDLLAGLRSAPLLRGVRGMPAADLDAVADAVVAVGDTALALGERLAALEVNPLFVRGGLVEALDAVVIWRDA